jgi:hypothetical protein
MRNAKSNTIKAASESLQEMLRRIGPFLPKPPKSVNIKPPQWEVLSEGTFPPMLLPKKRKVAKKTCQ